MAGDFIKCQIGNAYTVIQSKPPKGKDKTASFKCQQRLLDIVDAKARDTGDNRSGVICDAVDLFMRFFDYRHHLIAYEAEIKDFLKDRPVNITKRIA